MKLYILFERIEFEIVTSFESNSGPVSLHAWAQYIYDSGQPRSKALARDFLAYLLLE